MSKFGESLIDYLDLYKLTMLQWIWRRYRNVNVRFALSNRTKSVRLAEVVPEAHLGEKLEWARSLCITVHQLDWLRSLRAEGRRPLFDERFLLFLSHYRLPEFELAVRDGQFDLGFAGDWVNVSLWETVALSQTVECYTCAMTQGNPASLFTEGKTRFLEKAKRLEKFPGMRIIEIGTRPRYRAPRPEQSFSMAPLLLREQLVGTSNLGLACRFSVVPKGTMAHELYMVRAAMAESDDQLRHSQAEVHREWWDEYGRELSIALPDTFGSRFSFGDMSAEMALLWRGTRQDSGPPHDYSEAARAWYRRHGVDHREKELVYSDGLTVDTMADLYTTWSSHFKVGFGWGTNATNDLGLAPLSLVVKVVSANGRPTVKLSDNLAKATGPAEEVARYKRVFGYTGTLDQMCTY